MFNIASIRDSILKKIGSSEASDNAGSNLAAEQINTDDAVHSTAIAQTTDTGVQNEKSAETSTLDVQSGSVNLTSVDGKGDSSDTENQQQVTGPTDNCKSCESAQHTPTVQGDDENLPAPRENKRSHDHEIEKNGDSNRQLLYTQTDAVNEVSSANRHVLTASDSSDIMMECDDAGEEPVAVGDASCLPPASSLEKEQCEQGSGNTESLTEPEADKEKTVQDIVIKTEVIDEGYEQHQNNPGPSSFAEVNENIEGFENVFIKTEKDVDEEEDKNDDVVLLGVGYRNPYSDSEDDSDTDTSSVSSLEVPENHKERHHEEEGVEFTEPRTKGEMYPEDLPPIEDLQISISEETRLMQIGTVSGIVDVLVVIQSTMMVGGHVLPVNEDTVFFFEDRKPFGKVFEVFGPTRAPFYSVRFNSREDIVNKGVDIGLKVYFAPDPAPTESDITRYVFMDSLLKLKGSDASWQDNNEPPASMLDYSDDEEEKRAKSKRKGGKGQGFRDGDDVNERKRNKNNGGVPEDDGVARSHQMSNTGSQGSSVDTHSRRFNQPHHSSRGRGGFRRGFGGGRPDFSGQSSQQPPQHTGPSHGTGFLQPSRFSGPSSGMPAGQPPMFSGPPGQMGFQPPPFSGHSRMPAHQSQTFSGPGSGMPPYQPPPFPGPSGGMHSGPPPMFWNGNTTMQPPQPPPVFPASSQQRPPFAQWAPLSPNLPY